MELQLAMKRIMECTSKDDQLHLCAQALIELDVHFNRWFALEGKKTLASERIPDVVIAHDRLSKSARKIADSLPPDEQTYQSDVLDGLLEILENFRALFTKVGIDWTTV